MNIIIYSPLRKCNIVICIFFFIPIIKWNKEYYIKTSCCEKVSKIAPEIGRRIEKGEEVNLNIDEIDLRNFDGSLETFVKENNYDLVISISSAFCLNHSDDLFIFK